MEKSHFSRLSAVSVGVIFLTYLGLSSLVRAEEISFESTRAAAEKGDPKTQYDLARRYERGTGVEKDYAKAAQWASKSADQGYSNSQALLGSYYGRGLGVGKDPQEAVKWYRKSAEQGDALAQYAMGGFYANGRGVAKDVNEIV